MEDGKMLTPEQLEECYPVMTDAQLSAVIRIVRETLREQGVETPELEEHDP
jgi:hypothetical protein